MPSVSSGKILVSGANGYIATWVVQDLLNSGFSVRGTVRSESKAAYLREHLKSFGDKLEIIIVDDITRDGAFDDCTADIDAIIHVASPAHANAAEPDDIIVPAVRGTTSILRSALKNRTSVKRIVITSSCAAVFAHEKGATQTRILTENDWNETSVPPVREKGRDADKMEMYRASKVLAERAAWDFWESEKSRLAGEGGLDWDLVVITPPWVFGPVLHEVPSPEAFGSTQSLWYNAVVKGTVQGDALTKNGYEWVDVRDVARAHVLALKVPGAGGERIITRGGRAVWQDFVNIARRICDNLPAGDEMYDPNKVFYPLNTMQTKASSSLGLNTTR